MRFAHGEAEADLAVIGDAETTGTEVTFHPSDATFTMTEFSFDTLEHRLRELAFLNSGVGIVLEDMRHAEPRRVELKFDGGLEAFARYLDRNKTTLIDTPSRCNRRLMILVSSWRCGGMTAITRRYCASPIIFPSAMAARIWPVFAAR